eukprot:gnl/Trimastix_PCT/520.p1 GENE.gnl/Trimastix_PCT/520~~gnl/Trimastix_PCT/520.p1  ORF type:complete len:222 (+),score=62.82 gnl/Trimastix_PCT/520:66-731(+)
MSLPERIFCAEDIVVPVDLPDILKNFTKEVIRANPDNIIEFSASYFTKLAQYTQGEAYKLAPDSFPMLRDLLSNMDTEHSGMLSKEQIIDACTEIDISEMTVQTILRFGKLEEEARINWYQFFAIAVSLLATSLLHAVEVLFGLLGDEQGFLDTPQLIRLVGYLVALDTDKPPEFMDELNSALQTTSEGKFAARLTFADFVGVPIAEQLRYGAMYREEPQN